MRALGRRNAGRTVRVSAALGALAVAVLLGAGPVGAGLAAPAPSTGGTIIVEN